MDSRAKSGLLRIGLPYRISLAIVGVAVAIAVLELIGPTVNAATAAQILLLVVLAEARFCGLLPAIIGSAFAAAGFVRYFVTPAGWRFGDPNDIAALVAFVLMAIVGGELALSAERRARQIEQLYQQLQAAFERESEAEAARRTERVKATLLDAMAHNLRTPLTAIKAAVTAVLQNRKPAPTMTIEQQWELLSVIDEEADRLNRFVGGLVTTSQVDRSTEMVSESSSALDAVRTAIARAAMLTRDHTVDVQIGGALPRVGIDERSLTEVLYILLDNASKYAPPGTSIRLSAQVDAAGFVALRVSDQGPGIPPEFRERVFERFFRVPNRESHDRNRTGGGVGLALAKQLIDAHRGQIVIDKAAQTTGTTVELRLPVEANAPDESLKIAQ